MWNPRLSFNLSLNRMLGSEKYSAAAQAVVVMCKSPHCVCISGAEDIQAHRTQTVTNAIAASFWPLLADPTVRTPMEPESKPTPLSQLHLT